MPKNFITLIMITSIVSLSHYTNTMMKHFTGFNRKSSALICNNQQLLQDRKCFLDYLADFTYPTPLYVIPSDHARAGSKSIQTLQYQDDLDIFGTQDEATEMADDYISQDKIDKTFILKRYVDRYGEPCTEKAIREAIGSYIGTSLGISVNKVKIIPARMPFLGKEFYKKSCTSTLHTYMAGKEVSLLSFIVATSDFLKIDIGDSFATEKCFESALLHPDLCNISILDLCADNDDRHTYNYRYQEKNNRFYAYDMDESFNTHPSMAYKALNFLREYLENGNITTKEKRILIRLKNSLKHFLFNFPKNSLYDLWMEKAQEAEYIYSDNEKKNVAYKLDTHRKDIQNLHSFLENFFNRKDQM